MGKETGILKDPFLSLCTCNHAHYDPILPPDYAHNGTEMGKCFRVNREVVCIK